MRESDNLTKVSGNYCNFPVCAGVDDHPVMLKQVQLSEYQDCDSKFSDKCSMEKESNRSLCNGMNVDVFDQSTIPNSTKRMPRDNLNLSCGQVIELDEKLKNFLKTPVNGDDSELESSNECHDSKIQFPSHQLSRSSSNHHSDDDVDEEWRNEPRVGDEFQVDFIPARLMQSPDYDVDNDQMLWDPSAVEQERVEQYLALVNHPSSSSEIVKDNEEALLLLRQCDNDVCEASRRFKFRPASYRSELSVWSTEECRQFEHGLTLYGKDFHTIHHNKVKTKSIGEIVKFYYVWKKSDRRKFNTKTRLGKKKEASQFSTLGREYVERLMDESEPSSSHSLHPHINHVREATRLQQDSYNPLSNDFTNSSAFSDDFINDSDIFENITPTLLAVDDYSSAALSSIDPAIYVAYSDPAQYAPVASTSVESSNCDSLNQNNNCSVRHQRAFSLQTNFVQSVKREQDSTALPADVLSSIDELESTYFISSSKPYSRVPDQSQHQDVDPPVYCSFGNLTNCNPLKQGERTHVETHTSISCSGYANSCVAQSSPLTEPESVTEDDSSNPGRVDCESRADIYPITC